MSDNRLYRLDMQVVTIFYLSYWETHKGVFTNYGGATQRECGGGGGQVKFYPYKKGVRKSFSHPEGGHKRFFGYF